MRSLLLALFLFSPGVFAGSGFGKGVAFVLGIGQGGASIENPDQTKAHYSLLAIHGKASAPLEESKDFALNVVGGVRYLDLENNANNGVQSETANLIGPGLGTQVRLYKFVLGIEYYMMMARHHAIGKISETTKYEMSLLDLYGGITIPFQQLSVTLSYSQSTGTVPNSKTGLSSSSPYTDQVYWLQFTYSTGASFNRFLGFLF